MIKKALVWLIINMVLPFVPLLLGLAFLTVTGKSYGIDTLLGGSEMLIIVFSAVAATTVEFLMFGPSHRETLYRSLLLLLALSTIAASLFLGLVFTFIQMNKPYDKVIVADAALYSSIAVFLLCFFSQITIWTNPPPAIPERN